MQTKKLEHDIDTRIDWINRNHLSSASEDGYTYFRLLYLLKCRDFELYEYEFGPEPIDERLCESGKRKFGFGSLTAFECDAIAWLNQQLVALQIEPARTPYLATTPHNSFG